MSTPGSILVSANVQEHLLGGRIVEDLRLPISIT